MQAAVIHFNIINNSLQASLPHFSAVSCILLTAIFPVISPAIELHRNLILYAEKVSPLCWAMGSRKEEKKKKRRKKPPDLLCFPFQELRGWGKGKKKEVSLTLNTSGVLWSPSQPCKAERKTVPCTSESWPCLFCWETPTRGDRTQLWKGNLGQQSKLQSGGPRTGS